MKWRSARESAAVQGPDASLRDNAELGPTRARAATDVQQAAKQIKSSGHFCTLVWTFNHARWISQVLRTLAWRGLGRKLRLEYHTGDLSDPPKA